MPGLEVQDIPSSNLDLAIVFAAESQVQETLADELPGLIRDGDGLFCTGVLDRPVGLDKKTQGAEGKLTDRVIDRGVRGDLGQGDGICWVRLSSLELNLGVDALASVRLGGSRKQLYELLLHG